MSRTLLARAEDVFLAVVERPLEERRALLDQLCAGENEVRAEVLSILEHHDGAAATAGFLKTGDVRRTLDAGPLLPSTRIGEFTILGVLGSGGMGVVYRAMQERPRRTVALKLMRHAPFGSRLTKRFESEAELLGRLQHPGIAQIFGAGIAQVGFGPQPYIAMELIEGPPITHFADVHRLSTRDRLALLLKVCAAAEHAHSKGVIHRDIKPANVLVGADGEPKLVDFGVARAVEPDLHALNTAAGELIGTLSYMSPEQVAGSPADVDTRTDVFALGLLMYELLSGRPARDLASAPLEEALRRIREDDPPLLSSRDRSLKGDIETIAARALARDRTRRYASAAELASEIQRHLTGEPIEARRDSAIYVIGRQIRRHWTVASVGAAAVLSLAAFSVYAWTQSIRQATLAGEARNAQGVAQSALEQAQREAAALRRSDYFNRIGFAQAAYAGGDSDRTMRLLESCPEDLRGWEWRYLYRLGDRSIAKLHSREQGAGGMALADRAGRFATYRLGEDVALWDLSTHARIGTISPPGGTYSVAITADGSVLATTSKNGVQFWDPRGTPIRRLEFDPPVGSADFSPDGRVMLLLGPSRHVRLADPASGAIRADTQLPGGILCARFSADSTRFAAGDSTGAISIFDSTSGVLIAQTSAPAAGVRSLAFSPDGRRLYSASEDGCDRVWDTPPGGPITQTAVFPAHRNKATAIALSPDGSKLASGSSDTTIKIIDPALGSELGTLTGHASTVVFLAFTGENQLISTSLDGTVRWWDLNRMEDGLHAAVESSILSISCTPDGARLYVGEAPGAIDAFEASSLTHSGHVASLSSPVSHLRASPDGRTIVTADFGGTVLAWPASGGAPPRLLARHQGLARDVAMCDARPWLASVGDDGLLKITDLATGSPVHELAAHPGGAYAVTFSPTGDRLVTGGADNHVRMWDTATWSLRADWAGHSAYIWSVTVTPFGVVSTGEDGAVLVWPDKGSTPRRLEGHHGPVYSAACSPDGKRLITGGYDNTVRLWDLESGTEILTLRGHTGSVRAVAFSPDGSTILSASDRGTIRLWSAAPHPSGAP